MRKSFGWEQSLGLKTSDKVGYLAQSMENDGILVSKNSVVGNATRRPLNVEEFRGFTIIEKGYALVFVNTRDAKTAQLFSLAHELGHVVIGRQGVSGGEDDHNENERWCNQFAAELLVPRDSLEDISVEQREIVKTISDLAPRFGVSREVLLWRLVELGKISQALAQSVLPQIRKQSSTAKQKQSEGAPSFHIVARSRVARRFFDTVRRRNGDDPKAYSGSLLGSEKL